MKNSQGVIIIIAAAPNNANRTNYFKAKINKTQENSKHRFDDLGDETINHIISECSKLAQKLHKARHNWVGNFTNGNSARN